MKTEHIHLKRSYKLSIQLHIFDENNISSDIHFIRLFIWVTGLNDEPRETKKADGLILVFGVAEETEKQKQ